MALARFSPIPGNVRRSAMVARFKITRPSAVRPAQAGAGCAGTAFELLAAGAAALAGGATLVAAVTSGAALPASGSVRGVTTRGELARAPSSPVSIDTAPTPANPTSASPLKTTRVTTGFQTQGGWFCFAAAESRLGTL